MGSSSLMVLGRIGKKEGECARIAIFMSGAGSNALRILEKERQTQTSYKVVVLVTDRPSQSSAQAIANQYQLPLVALDIIEFYRQHGVKKVTIATPEGYAIREAWTQKLLEKLEPYQIDFGIFAGFIPLCNIMKAFPCLNVHPGDLTYEEGGKRILVGLHTIPIEAAILRGLSYLRSSVILTEPLTGNSEHMDSGPILGISTPVPVDLRGWSLEKLREIAGVRPSQRPAKGFMDALEELAIYNQNRLKQEGDWVVFPQVVEKFAEGRYALDVNRQLHFRMDGSTWIPVKTIEYDRTGNFRILPSET